MKKLVILFILLTSPAFASTPTVIATFECLGVTWAPDTGGGTTATLEYRVNGDSTWLDALDMYWDSGYTVAVLANCDGAAGMVARKIGKLLTIKIRQES